MCTNRTQEIFASPNSIRPKKKKNSFVFTTTIFSESKRRPGGWEVDFWFTTFFQISRAPDKQEKDDPLYIENLSLIERRERKRLHRRFRRKKRKKLWSPPGKVFFEKNIKYYNNILSSTVSMKRPRVLVFSSRKNYEKFPLKSLLQDSVGSEFRKNTLSKEEGNPEWPRFFVLFL